MKLGIIIFCLVTSCSFILAPPKHGVLQHESKTQKKYKTKQDKLDDELLDELLNATQNSPDYKHAKAPLSKYEREFKALKNAGKNMGFLLSIKDRSAELCRNLLARGADCNAFDSNNDTALHHAIMSSVDSTEKIEMLIAHGANINRLSDQKVGPLLIAIELDKQEIVQKLIAHGVDVNAQTSDEVTPLQVAISRTKPNLAIVRMLIEAGAKDLQDRGGFTALMIAVFANNMAAAQMLVDAKFDLEKTNKDGITALHFAIEKAGIELVEMLIAHGADYNRANSFGNASLAHAINKQNDAAAELFIRAGANLNARNKHGYTALTHAFAYRNYNIIEKLLAAGADPKIKNYQGSSPFIMAKKINDEKITQLMGKNDEKITQLMGKYAAEDLEKQNNKKLLQKFYQDLHQYRNDKHRKDAFGLEAHQRSSPLFHWADRWNEILDHAHKLNQKID